MIRAVAILLALMAFPALAQEGEARFVAVPNGSGVGAWVIDTQTGTVKFCFPQGNSNATGGYVATCTGVTQ